MFRVNQINGILMVSFVLFSSFARALCFSLTIFGDNFLRWIRGGKKLPFCCAQGCKCQMGVVDWEFDRHQHTLLLIIGVEVFRDLYLLQPQATDLQRDRHRHIPAVASALVARCQTCQVLTHPPFFVLPDLPYLPHTSHTSRNSNMIQCFFSGIECLGEWIHPATVPACSSWVTGMPTRQPSPNCSGCWLLVLAPKDIPTPWPWRWESGLVLRKWFLNLPSSHKLHRPRILMNFQGSPGQ